MFRAVFAPLLALLTLLGAGGAAAAAESQALAVDVHAGVPQVRGLSHYAVSRPIAVRVTAPGARGAVLLGLGPDGTNLRVPLAGEAAGVFAGSATLATPGTWSLAVATAAAGGAESVASQSFALVVDPGPSRFDIALLLVLAFASVGGGVGVIAAGRRAAPLHTAM